MRGKKDSILASFHCLKPIFFHDFICWAITMTKVLSELFPGITHFIFAAVLCETQCFFLRVQTLSQREVTDLPRVPQLIGGVSDLLNSLWSSLCVSLSLLLSRIKKEGGRRGHTLPVLRKIPRKHQTTLSFTERNHMTPFDLSAREAGERVLYPAWPCSSLKSSVLLLWIKGEQTMGNEHQPWPWKTSLKLPFKRYMKGDFTLVVGKWGNKQSRQKDSTYRSSPGVRARMHAAFEQPRTSCAAGLRKAMRVPSPSTRPADSQI